jgi:hypothetical protein
LPVLSECASGWPLHHWKQSRPATVIESMKTVSYFSSTFGSPYLLQIAW